MGRSAVDELLSRVTRLERRKIMSRPPKCPKCRTVCQRHEGMIKNHVVFACRPCRAFKLEKHSEWLVNVGYVLARLSELAAQIDGKDPDDDLDSQLDDSKWVTIMIE